MFTVAFDIPETDSFQVITDTLDALTTLAELILSTYPLASVTSMDREPIEMGV